MSSWSTMSLAPRRGPAMAVEQWLDRDEDADGELVDGELAEEEVPDVVHETAVSWFLFFFERALAGEGLVLGSELRIVVGAGKGRKADASVFFADRLPLPGHGGVRVPPDIVLEVVTPTPRDERRDRIEKMDDYAAFGVRYYWIVDPALMSVEVFELSGGRYARVVAATAGAFSAPGLGATCDVDALWAKIRKVTGR
jgi:Uma2 family endonuclease